MHHTYEYHPKGGGGDIEMILLHKVLEMSETGLYKWDQWLSGQWNGKKTDNMTEFSGLMERLYILKWWVHKYSEYTETCLQFQVTSTGNYTIKKKVQYLRFSINDKSEFRTQKQL